MIHARIGPNETISEFVDIDPAVRAEWIASGNPKADAYRPVYVDPMPPYDDTRQAVDARYVVAVDRVDKRWTVRALTADELRKVWTPLDFLARFTASEMAAIESARELNADVQSFYRSALAAQEIVSDDSRTLAGMSLLVALGLVTQSRATEILGT
jgi:hypothetical protein